MARVAAALALLLAAVMAGGVPARAQTGQTPQDPKAHDTEAHETEAHTLSGRYVGFGGSAGAVLTLAQQGARVLGQFTDSAGHVYRLDGQAVGARAQGALARAGARSFFLLETRPLGVQFMVIPAAPDGSPDMDSAVQMALARDDADVRGLIDPDADDNAEARAGSGAAGVPALEAVLGEGALSGRALADAYAALPARLRELVRLFDHVQADVVGRLCAGVAAGLVPAGHRGVALALEGQAGDCATIHRLRAQALRGRGRDVFAARLGVQRDLLAATLACNDDGGAGVGGGRGDAAAAVCQTAGAMNAAMFEQWRPAAAIFAALAEEAGDGAQSGGGQGPGGRGGDGARGGEGVDLRLRRAE